MQELWIKEPMSNEKTPYVTSSSNEFVKSLRGFLLGVVFSIGTFLGFHFILVPWLVPEYKDPLGTLNPGGRNAIIFNSVSPNNLFRVQMIQPPVGESDTRVTEVRIYKLNQNSPIMVYRSLSVSKFAGNEVIQWTKDSFYFIILARYDADGYNDKSRKNNSYDIDSLYNSRSNELLSGGCIVSVYDPSSYEPEFRSRDCNMMHMEDLNPPMKKSPQPFPSIQEIKKMEWVNPVESLEAE